VIARRFLAAIEDCFKTLQRFPLYGSAREMFAPGLRVLFHGHYAIYYVPLAAELVIVRVLHGARDTAAIAEQGGFNYE
jgi:toxin ParE1/3/4